DNETCIGIAEEHCQGACEKKEVPQSYNERVLEAIASLTQRPSYVVLDKGLSENEVSCIMVDGGSFFGMGYLPKNLEKISRQTIQEYIKPYKENSYIRTLLLSHASNFPSQIRILSE
ncbi:MAG TPA: hypothetical protein VL095_05810, partial [Flavisolibacter sp.]|nr:hypothetical protein [Flavisolibacter sp.]